MACYIGWLMGLRVSEKLAAGSIRDEISRPLYAPWTIALRLFVFVIQDLGGLFYCYPLKWVPHCLSEGSGQGFYFRVQYAITN
jgi:hypothetical protein